jgi:hypothetical protein
MTIFGIVVFLLLMYIVAYGMVIIDVHQRWDNWSDTKTNLSVLGLVVFFYAGTYMISRNLINN